MICPCKTEGVPREFLLLLSYFGTKKLSNLYPIESNCLGVMVAVQMRFQEDLYLSQPGASRINIVYVNYVVTSPHQKHWKA